MSIALWNEVAELKERVLSLEKQYAALLDLALESRQDDRQSARPTLTLKKKSDHPT